jgi:uncharacterized membrane protein YidH (DUF202 family)
MGRFVKSFSVSRFSFGVCCLVFVSRLAFLVFRFSFGVCCCLFGVCCLVLGLLKFK